MKKPPFFIIIITLFFALFAGMSTAGVKYVAVVETEVDAASGASAEMTSAEVRLMTAGLRREAVKNLPKDRFSIMTAETVQAQGGAVLESCIDENCVITLGAKIGADYIVRGIISKLRSRFALSAEMYETENGNLVASSDLVSSENIGELVEKGAAACGEMYRTFANTYKSTRKTPATTYTVAVNVNPAGGGATSRYPDQADYAPGTDVYVAAGPSKGYKFVGWSGDVADTANPVTVTVDTDKTLTANFQLKARREAGADSRQAGKFFNTSDGEYTEAAKPAKSKTGTVEKKKRDFYFAPKYVTLVGVPTSWGGVDYEVGMNFGDGMFLGIDWFGWGSDFDAKTFMMGAGAGLGYEYNLWEKLQIGGGLFMGGWFIGNKNQDHKPGEDWPEFKSTFYLFAPVAKLCWDFVELTYRGLLGSKSVLTNQLMAGFYVSTSKREDMKYEYYFAPKYSALLGQSNWTAINLDLEGGVVLDNGMFLGLGFDANLRDTEWSMLGGGVNLGNVYDLWNQLQLVYGISAGYWMVTHNYWFLGEGMYYSDDFDDWSSNFLAPFLKLRWNFLEITYRGLLGYREVRVFDTPDKYYYHFEDKGFGWNHHQLMLGFYFATSKRDRSK